MAASITTGPAILPINTVPTVRAAISTVTPDASYPTGGYALTAAQLGLSTVAYALCNVVGSAANNGAVAASWNSATGKLQLWASSGVSPVGLVEVANAVNLSGLTVQVLALGN